MNAPLRLPEGIHPNVPEGAYHADPAMDPSASSGILRKIYTASEDHARAAHPRLNPNYRETPSTEAMNRGTILHSLVMETDAPFEVLDVPDYTTKAARALRDETIAAGLIPVKTDQMIELEDTASAIRARLRGMPEVWAAMKDAIESRMTEVTLIWRESGILCRCRYDTLPASRFKASYDLKFTGLTAEPETFGKKVTGDYAFQADFYPRAVRALRGDSPLFVFVACETEAPYGVTLHALDPFAADEARQKVDEALAAWGHALRSGIWPSYATQIHYHGPKPWEVEAAETRRSIRSFPPKPSPAEIARGNEFTRRMIEVSR